MTTEEIIADLRQNGLTSASIYTRMERAANRLEELQRANQNTLADLALAVSERTPHDYGMLKREIEHLKRELTEFIRERNKTVADLIKQRAVAYHRFSQQITATPQELSRLEIAAMLLAQWAGANADKLNPIAWNALKIADTLIAEAKEAK